MTVDTLSSNLIKCFAADATSATYPSRIPTLTEPTVTNNPGLVELSPKLITGNQILFFPFGQGAASDTFNVQLLGWKQTQVLDTIVLWVPFVLCELTVTLGTTTGVAGTPAVVADLFANNLAIVTGNENIDIELVIPGNNQLAYAMIDLKGNALVEFIVDLDSSATAANGLICLL